MQAAAQGISVNFSSGIMEIMLVLKRAHHQLITFLLIVGNCSWRYQSSIKIPNGSYKYETGWAWPWEDVGSTGGLSQYYTAQSWQQNDFDSECHRIRFGWKQTSCPRY